MGGSGIRSAVGAVVGLCSRWEAGNLLQRACVAMGLGIVRWERGDFMQTRYRRLRFRLLYRKSGPLVTSDDP